MLTVGCRGSHGSGQKFVAWRTPVGILSSHQRGRVVDVAAAVEVIGGRAEANGDRVGRVDPRIVPRAI